MFKVIALMMGYSRSAILLASAMAALGGAGSAVLMVLINQRLTGEAFSWTTAALSFAGVVLAVLVFNLLSRVLLVQVAQRTEYDLRMHLVRRVLATPLRKLEEVGAGRIVGVLTNDIQNIGMISVMLPNLCVNAAMLLGCFAYLAWLSLPLLGVLLLFLAVTIAINHLLHRRANQLLTAARERLDVLMRHFTALNEGIKELKLHDARSRAFLNDAVEPTTATLKEHNTRAMKGYALANAWSQVLFFCFVGLVIYGLPRVQEVTPVLLTSYTLTIFFLRAPLVALVDMLPNLGRAGVALAKLETLGLSLSNLGEESDRVVQRPPCRKLELERITHSYYRELEDDNFTLGPIDFTLNAGELVFLVGGNGSGKTTLAKVLCGLYQPESGNIRRDGKLVGDHNQDEYRQLFSVVFSEFFLFDTLLGLESPELDAQAREYLRLLQLDRKVRVEAGALSTTELSRGQRKRLALLTAYLEDRPFYIFDEWAADQDPYFKDIFYRQLLPELRARGKGVLVISHDIHYHDTADRIVRLDYGKLDETGDLPVSRPGTQLAAG